MNAARRLVLLSLGASAVTAGALFAASRSTRREPTGAGSLLTAPEVRALYDRLAPFYDVLAAGYALVGSGRFRRHAVASLGLRPGDLAVDLGCGTGANLPYLVESVGPSGHILGVDLSPGMLAQARKHIAQEGWQNVELVCTDVRTLAFPDRVQGVVSTFALEMVPEHAEVIARAVAALEPGRRIAVAGLRRPERWPEWVIRLGAWVNRPFGVTRAYEAIQPWHALRRHTREVRYEEHLLGAAYLSVGEWIPPALPVPSQAQPEHA